MHLVVLAFIGVRSFKHTIHGRSQGGSWGARDPPFVSLFVSKQPTIFRWQFGEYPMYESVWPLLWKILATPMTPSIVRRRVSLPLRLFLRISHCSESDSVSNRDFKSVILKCFTYCFLYCVRNIFLSVLSKRSIRSKERTSWTWLLEINTVLKMAVFGKSCWNVDTRKMLLSVLKRYFLVLSKRWLRREYWIL